MAPLQRKSQAYICRWGFCDRGERITLEPRQCFTKKLIWFSSHKNTNHHFTDATSLHSVVLRGCRFDRFVEYKSLARFANK